MSRFVLSALEAPLGPVGVFHLRKGDIVAVKSQHGPWELDVITKVMTDGTGFVTDNGTSVISWDRQGVDVLKVTGVECIGAPTRQDDL